MDSYLPSRHELPRLALAFVLLALSSSAMEALWYLVIAKELYARTIGTLMREQFDVGIAVLFYVCYALGASLLVLRGALRADSWRLALAGGALYGFSCFAAHDLTDLADLKDYSALISVVDIGWGTFMTACSCTLSFILCRRLAGPACASDPASASDSASEPACASVPVPAPRSPTP
jgi:uncharacterized membrane protein